MRLGRLYLKRFKRFTGMLLALMLLLTIFSGNTFAADTQDNNSAQYLQEVRNFINLKYNGVIDEEALNKATSVKDMFELLDDYSVFLTQKDYEALTASLGGSVEGVGVGVDYEGKYVIVLKVFDNSPAKKAGVLKGDKIAQVNGVSVAGKSMEDVTSMVKGLAGTTVKVGFIRQGVKNIITLEMERAVVDIPSVHYEIRNDIGYIHIDTFSSNAYSGVTKALEYFDSKKITKVVLDLRNNPGGYADQAAKIARYFVPKGLITTLDYKDEADPDTFYYSDLEKTKYKLAVLVNENSASASEILTGAIKDTNAGIIIGNKTFGKAKVQSSFPILSNEAYDIFNQDSEIKSVNALDFPYALIDDLLGWAKMTIGLYYTPNGTCIDLKGIEPDVKVVEPKAEDYIPVNMVEPLSVVVKPSLGTQYTDVFYAECVLKLLQYNVDKPDNTLDKKTFEAIKKFQKDNKVYSYGVLDFCTQKLLSEKLASLKVSKDTAYAKAVQLLK